MNSAHDDDPVALVTGAAHRIGADIARRLHTEGLRVLVHYRQSAAAASALVDELNAQRPDSARALPGDLVQGDQVQALAEAALAHWGHINVLVNNASSFYPTPVGEATDDDWHALIDSNLKGPFFLSQALAASLTERRGCIINIVDTHFQRPLPGHSLYSIAKAGVAMMTRSLAQELAPAVRVNGVAPGAILWPEQALANGEQEDILQRTALGRLGETRDIAETVAFLALRAPFITGQIIAVDGGRSLNM